MSSVSFKSAYINNNQVILELDDSSHPNNVQSTFGFHTRKTFPEETEHHKCYKPKKNVQRTT